LIASVGLYAHLTTLSVPQTTQCRKVSETVRWVAKVV